MLQTLDKVSPPELIALLKQRPVEPQTTYVCLVLNSKDEVALEEYELDHDFKISDIFGDAEEVEDDEELTEEDLEDAHDYLGWVISYPNPFGLAREQMHDFILALFAQNGKHSRNLIKALRAATEAEGIFEDAA